MVTYFVIVLCKGNLKIILLLQLADTIAALVIFLNGQTVRVAKEDREDDQTQNVRS